MGGRGKRDASTGRRQSRRGRDAQSRTARARDRQQGDSRTVMSSVPLKKKGIYFGKFQAYTKVNGLVSRTSMYCAQLEQLTHSQSRFI